MKTKLPPDLRDAIIVTAYRQLLAEHTPDREGQYTFTQGKLIGRIHALGLDQGHMTLIADNLLRQDIALLKDGWEIRPQPEFYCQINSHATITFSKKEKHGTNRDASPTSGTNLP